MIKSNSIFTSILSELTGYSKKIDSGKANYSDLVKLQRLRTRINDGYNNNFYPYSKYRLLDGLCIDLENYMHELVRVNHELKRFSKHSRIA